MELKRCAQSKRILSKQVSKLEQEKSNLGNKVLDAKEALKKAARCVFMLTLFVATMNHINFIAR